VKELKDRLRDEGLPTSGVKAELIERLTTTAISVSHTDASLSSTTPQVMKKTSTKVLPPSQPSSSTKQKQQRSSSKFTINPNWQKEFNIKALTDEFDIMARKEGFDTTHSYYANDATFEENFTDDDYEIDLDDDDNDDELDDDDDDIPDFGILTSSSSSSVQQSMEERLAAARRDQTMGRISVPTTLDKFSQDVSFDELKKLGFRREVNPYGDDETPRREQFKVITGSLTCTGCGTPFQMSDELRPGYLPPEKYDVQTKLAKIEEIQKLQRKAQSEWSSEDEVNWLLQQTPSPVTTTDGGSSSSGNDVEDYTNLSVDEMAEKFGLDLDILSRKKVICKRCHQLQNFGSVEQKLRPGWTDEPTLSQEQFRKLLFPLRQKKAVILALVDLFDFSGSVLPELDQIAGDNPVILAANKADLLPSEMGQTRAENWVRRELEYQQVKSIANIGGAVRLVSCKTGFGIPAMMEKARKLADEMECDIYVVGAANAGKSTLVNYLLDEANRSSNKEKYGGKRRAGNANKYKGSVTTSPLPGTTLQFIKIDLGDGMSLYDTPGLLVPGCLTERLTPEELKIVVPKKQIEPITFRIASGKCCLVGGLAKIELIGDCKPFLFTFFVANEIKLHMTDSERADEVIANHVGKMLTPPLEPGPQRVAEIGEFEYHEIDVEGEGWKKAAADITLRGLGWVAVTGAGVAKVRIGVPKGIGITVRPPLMPFDVWEATAKYTGGRAVRKSGKSRSGKRRAGVGRN
jgi:ribosome biogenesis GTPase A